MAAGGVGTPVWLAITLALIAAGASLVVAVLGRRTSRDVEVLKETLRQKGAERDARRDYEYEARKRLYAECEPLLFQTIDLVEHARTRIAGLARASRENGVRPDGSGWLAGPGYYFKSTVYFLLAPMTSFKILQRRLTVIDLGLEPRLHEQYEILKLVFLSFATDFELAKREPKLDYRPDYEAPSESEWMRLLREQPSVHSRQGLFYGMLDLVAEDFIGPTSQDEDGAPGVERCKSFGAFLNEFNEQGSDIDRLRPEAESLFGGFHPQRKPVLWRVLVSQALLYDAFLGVDTDIAKLEDVLDWGKPGGDAGEDIATTLRVVSDYVNSDLAHLRETVASSARGGRKPSAS